jgi:hypothetical protein
MLPRSDFGFFQIDVHCKDGDYPSLSGIAYFLHDFNLLYEFSRIVEDPKYRDYRFSRFSVYRNRRRIDPNDQLVVRRLTRESPLEFIAAVAALPAAATAIWVLVQTFEKIWNMPVNHDILKLNREKLKRELEGQTNAPPLSEGSEHRFREQLRYREAEYFYERIEHHLADNLIRVAEIDVTYTRELPPKAEGPK